MSNVIDTFKQLETLGLIDNINMSELETSLLATLDAEEVENMLLLSEKPGFLKEMKLEDLVKLPFAKAHTVTKQVSMQKRIALLEELEERRAYLYEQTARYVGVEIDLLLTPQQFQQIIGKIKHLEIIQTWLYGIE